jgi:hypothetical protein
MGNGKLGSFRERWLFEGELSNIYGAAMRFLSLISIIALLVSGCVNLSTQGDNETKLHAIGIYEGPVHKPTEPSGSTISVHVYSKGHPIVLALFNYESVLWDITVSDDVVIKEIILSSYHHSQVSGVDEATVKVTRRSLGMGYDDKTMKSATHKLKQATDLDVKSFQTQYRGFEFSVL